MYLCSKPSTEDQITIPREYNTCVSSLQQGHGNSELCKSEGENAQNVPLLEKNSCFFLFPVTYKQTQFRRETRMCLSSAAAVASVRASIGAGSMSISSSGIGLC